MNLCFIVSFHCVTVFFCFFSFIASSNDQMKSLLFHFIVRQCKFQLFRYLPELLAHIPFIFIFDNTTCMFNCFFSDSFLLFEILASVYIRFLWECSNLSKFRNFCLLDSKISKLSKVANSRSLFTRKLFFSRNELRSGFCTVLRAENRLLLTQSNHVSPLLQCNCQIGFSVKFFLVKIDHIPIQGLEIPFRLDLRNNDVTLGGLMALSLAARENKSLTRIDLDKPPKDNTLPIELIVSYTYS